MWFMSIFTLSLINLIFISTASGHSNQNQECYLWGVEISLSQIKVNITLTKCDDMYFIIVYSLIYFLCTV